mmetsp:Transcript_5437/g.23001  ORF Transcript_5437/g.23001 Transcript_5437/m.23001 type:complete len:202 (+) Transcript_5437:148-753(+)
MGAAAWAAAARAAAGSGPDADCRMSEVPRCCRLATARGPRSSAMSLALQARHRAAGLAFIASSSEGSAPRLGSSREAKGSKRRPAGWPSRPGATARRRTSSSAEAQRAGSSPPVQAARDMASASSTSSKDMTPSPPVSARNSKRTCSWAASSRQTSSPMSATATLWASLPYFASGRVNPSGPACGCATSQSRSMPPTASRD